LPLNNHPRTKNQEVLCFCVVEKIPEPELVGENRLDALETLDDVDGLD